VFSRRPDSADTTFVGLMGIAVCAAAGPRRDGTLSPIGKVCREVVSMEPDSIEFSPLAATESEAAPWVDRVVRSPVVRSGYLSLAGHLLLCILLAVFALEKKPSPRLRPLVFSMSRQPQDDAAGDQAAAVEIGAADEAAGGEAIAQARASAPATEAPLVDEPPLVAMAAIDSLPTSDAVGAEAIPEAEPSDQAIAPPLGAGPIAQPVSARGGPARPAASGRATARVAIGGGPPDGKPFASRTGAGRSASVRGRGGNAASEAAVERGLEWLALHQAVDGSWQFDLSGCRCNGACRDPGSLTSSTASTAIALLPFLGAGHTHVDGRHQETVSRGIYYLISRMQRTSRGGDFCEGTMYGHGVTTLALAEALGMTKDDMLVPPVRDAIRFIETAQDMHSGGWRYLPGQAGDTTVTAWQLAALKSAQLAGLEAPSPTIDGVRRFLDRVQTLNGAAYGYRSPSAKPCTSAIGLLCRMYTGWGPEQEPLNRGLTTLAKPGPAPQAIYQNFYLAQALVQSDHPVWPRWNIKNRDQLVAQQTRVAHEAGSWSFDDRDTAPGGRLAHTALAILTLEVYYRLLPIYRQEAVESEF
jgi:hypothetical protein